ARNRPALEFLGRGIEAYDRVRLGTGLVVPERALGEDDAVGLGFRAARGGPFLHLAGLGVEPAEGAARKVRVPDDVVALEREAARSCGCIRQREFLDRHGLRIDARDLRRAELDKPWNALGVDHQP